ncbi:FG-GAP repeat domain-containing protein [Sorangium sp. So ce513]|uniref:FG-GAP repeat domain-containing protein n=1 Tax=Sorangium sp. So ce513 TaxID=3133315 RepID=UPI003F5F6F5C
MRKPATVVRAASAACALLSVAACAHDIDPQREARPMEPPDPSLGAAQQGIGERRWVISQARDFNADGMADVLWNDAERGLAAVWLMEGTRLLAPGPFIPGPPGARWFAKAGDFNADGMADLLWRHDEQGAMAVWLMEGTRLLAPGPILPGPGGGGWLTRAIDYNADDMADVLWSHGEKGVMAVWLMEGTRLLAPGPFIPGPLGDGWDVAAVGDYNADGMSDAVWYHAEQNLMSVWLMEGTRLLAPGPPIPGPLGDGWDIAWGADFNGDGMADVLWNNTEQNLIAVWLMEGTRLLAPGPPIPGPLGDGWVVRTTGDLNFDGMVDVVWQKGETSQMAVWLMEGSELLAPGPVIPGPDGGG